MSTVEEVAAAIASGAPVVIPTDTVYGLACRPDREDAVRALSALKGRSPDQPIALVAASIEAVVELVPELGVSSLLSGPFTVVAANPARRLPWLTGTRLETIGVRLPELSGDAADLLTRVGVVAATSANLHGGPDPRRVEEIPDGILAAVAAVLDVGALPGTASTVVDVTGLEPRILREGAVTAAETLARVARSAE